MVRKEKEPAHKSQNIPIVGIVVLYPVSIHLASPSKSETYTISPSFSLYRMVVFPAASRPTIKIRISFFPQSLSNSFENVRPMFAVQLMKVKNAV